MTFDPYKYSSAALKLSIFAGAEAQLGKLHLFHLKSRTKRIDFVDSKHFEVTWLHLLGTKFVYPPSRPHM